MGFFDGYPYTNWHNVNLDWVLERVKEWGELVKENDQAFKDLQEANEAFKQYVTEYLQNLDVQEEINIKMDSLLESGVLTEYLQPYISTDVTTWLEENITEPVGVVIDSSLTVAGAAADAKKTGLEINKVKEDFTSIKLQNVSTVENDLDVALSDNRGNVICELSNGHIKTKYFDSSENLGALSVKTIIDDSDTLYIADNEGYTLAELDGGYWRSKRFINKKISILGDSICTFNGFSPSAYGPVYPNQASGVTSLSQMWFEIVSKTLCSEVIVSSSLSGCQVCGDSQDNNGYSMCSTVRVNSLTKNGITPDIIIIFGGTNDWFFNRQLGSFNSQSDIPSEGNIEFFSDAYALMLYKIMTLYPNASIYCCTLTNRITSSDNQYPIKNANNDTIYDFNEAIKNIAGMFGVNIINFDKCGLTIYNSNQYTYDRLHPNANGHKLLADEAIRDMLK